MREGGVGDDELHVGRVLERVGDVAVADDPIHQRLDLRLRVTRPHLYSDAAEAEAFVIGVDVHGEVREVHTALAERVVHGHREAHRERGKEQFGRRRTGIGSRVLGRLVGDDLEITDANAAAIAAFPRGGDVHGEHGV